MPASWASRKILRTLIVPLMPFAAGFDVAGIINLLLNIPLFLLAFRSISRGFFVKTVISIIVQTAVMSLVPIPSEPILGDMLASCLIGGILGGLGVGLTLLQWKLQWNGHHRPLSKKNFPITTAHQESMWCCTASVR